MPSSQVGPLAQAPTSLVKGSRASGSADEVLIIALAALTYDMLCGGSDGNGRSLEDVMKAVEGCSVGYVEGSAWMTPEAWRRGDKWIVAYLKELCGVTAHEVANTLPVAFGAAVVEHGGGVAYEPTKADLKDHFGPLARAKDKKGWLAGVPHGPRAKERPLRLLYLAPRVVALLRASRGALGPLVLEAYDLAIGTDHKAHASAQKSVLKAQYASLVDRIAAVEMDADGARDAVDTNIAAANEAAALLAAERRAEVNARVGARSDSTRECARAADGEEIPRAAKRLRKEQAAIAGLRASGAAKDRRMLALRGSSPAALLAAQKERARLNRRIKQLEFDLDNARRDAAAARAEAAAARADGAPDRAKMPRSVSVAIRTVFLLPDEEGTVLGAPRGVSLCRGITNFAIVQYHTRQGRSPGTLHCKMGYDSAKIAEPPTAGDVGAHRPASTQKLSASRVAVTNRLAKR